MKSLLARFLISLAFVVFIIAKLDLSSVKSIKTSPSFLIPIFFLSLLMILTKSFRWRILLRVADYNVGFWDSVKVYLVGIFYGLLSPGKIGELGKVYFFSEQTKVLGVSIFEKILDVAVLLILSSIPLFLYPVSYELRLMILVAGIITVSLSFLIIAFIKVTSLKKFTSRILKFLRIKGEVEDILEVFKLKSATFATILGLTAIYYLLVYVATALILKLLSLNCVELVMWYPLMILLSNVPITISGIGLREYIGYLIFNIYGLEGSFGVIFVFLGFAFYTFIPALIGYAVVLREGVRWRVK